MRFLNYLYQLKVNLNKYFSTNSAVSHQEEKYPYAEEVNTMLKRKLKKKCKKAVQEVQYIKNFTHWPVTEAKKSLEKNAIIYLNVNRNKRTTIAAEIEKENKVIKAIDKTALSNKVIVIKKRHK